MNNNIRIVETKVVNYIKTIEINGKHIQPTIYNVVSMIDDLGYLRSEPLDKGAITMVEKDGIFDIEGKK